MIDWTDVASFATAGGTLVLAVATFASVRSANRASRTAERAHLISVRPVLVPSRLEDRTEKVNWYDMHWASVHGGRAIAEVVDGNIYLAMSLRNVGSGLAVLHGWWPTTDRERAGRAHAPLEAFRMQTRDLYVPAGDLSFWQAAIREPADPDYDDLVAAINERRLISIELLYGDHEGGQRTISRFNLIPRSGDETDWMCTVALHWNLDQPDPR
ncbi:MAG TPA: hypothetical protein VLZ77_17045 [Acidimicrobiales bacterium]|nr:hypothetical protein [Acidimicrobiales bacterium]